MTDLTELNKLEEYLKDKGIRYERIDRKPIQDELGIILHFTERHQICVPKEDLRFKKWDAICQPGSYGCQEGLLEIMDKLISAEYLYLKMVESTDEAMEYCYPCMRVLKAIEEAPAVDAVPIRHAKLLNAHPYGECSNCGYLIDIRQEFNYCPMCGYKIEDLNHAKS